MSANLGGRGGGFPIGQQEQHYHSGSHSPQQHQQHIQQQPGYLYVEQPQPHQEQQHIPAPAGGSTSAYSRQRPDTLISTILQQREGGNVMAGGATGGSFVIPHQAAAHQFAYAAAPGAAYGATELHFQDLQPVDQPHYHTVQPMQPTNHYSIGGSAGAGGGQQHFAAYVPYGSTGGAGGHYPYAPSHQAISYYQPYHPSGGEQAILLQPDDFELTSAGGGARLQQQHHQLSTLIHNPAQPTVAVSHWGGPGGGATMHRLSEVDPTHPHGLEIATQIADGGRAAPSTSMAGPGPAAMAQGSPASGPLRKMSQSTSVDSEHLATHKRIMDDIKVRVLQQGGELPVGMSMPDLPTEEEEAPEEETSLAAPGGAPPSSPGGEERLPPLGAGGRMKAGMKTTSRFRGVTYHRRTGRWEAHLWYQGRQMYLGGFSSEAKAATAYDFMALRCRGTKAILNFDRKNYENDLPWLTKVTRDELVLSLRRHSKGFARGSSKFRGVSLNPNGRWEARCSEGGRKYSYLGLFDSEMDAAIAYDQTCVKRYGYNAITNRPLSLYKEQLQEYERRVAEEGDKPQGGEGGEEEEADEVQRSVQKHDSAGIVKQEGNFGDDEPNRPL